MLEIKRFTYKDRPREVIVTQESDSLTRGIDLTHLDESVRDAAREAAKNVTLSDKRDEASMAEMEKLRKYMTAFRCFKRALVVD